jgi:hypothetical protein
MVLCKLYLLAGNHGECGENKRNMLEINFEMNVIEMYTIFFIVMMRNWNLGTTSTSKVESLVGNTLWTTYIETWSGRFARKASAQQVCCSSYYFIARHKKFKTVILEIHEQNF